MFEKEERMLREMKRETADNTEAVSDEALDAVIRSGIRGGKRRLQYRSRRGTFSAIAVVLAAALLLVMWGSVPGSLVGPKHQLAQGPYPPLTGFDLGEDITLNTANKHGLIQPIHQSADQGDYRVTVNGILIGTQQMEIFYTIENKTEVPLDVKRVEIKRQGSAEELPYSVGSSGGYQLGKGTHQAQLNVFMQESGQLQQNLTFSFAIAPYSTNTVYDRKTENEQVLDINVTLDLGTVREYVKTVPLNQMLQIEKQRFYLVEAVLSPAGIVLKAKVPSGNTMKVTGLWDVYLESVVDGQPVRLGSGSAFLPGEGDEMTYFFASNILDNPESITLKAGGFHAVDPAEMTVVVDTDKGQVLRSPDGGIRFGEYAEHTLTLEYEEKVDSNRGSVSIKPEFMDGEGNEHTLDTGRGISFSTRSDSAGGINKMTQYLYLEPETYPQPLTFELSSYPGVMKQGLRVPIL